MITKQPKWLTHEPATVVDIAPWAKTEATTDTQIMMNAKLREGGRDSTFWACTSPRSDATKGGFTSCRQQADTSKRADSIAAASYAVE